MEKKKPVQRNFIRQILREKAYVRSFLLSSRAKEEWKMFEGSAVVDKGA